MVDARLNFGKAPLEILGDMDTLLMAIHVQPNTPGHGTQLRGPSDPESVIRRIKEM